MDLFTQNAKRNQQPNCLPYGRLIIAPNVEGQASYVWGVTVSVAQSACGGGERGVSQHRCCTCNGEDAGSGKDSCSMCMRTGRLTRP